MMAILAASYLLIDDGQPAIRRVEYDVEKEVGRLLASDYPYKEWIAEMRRKGSYVPPPENEAVEVRSLRTLNQTIQSLWCHARESAPACYGTPCQFLPLALCILCRCVRRNHSDIPFPFRREIHNADTYARKWHGSEVVAIPVAVADAPLPGYLIQAHAQRVCG